MKQLKKIMSAAAVILTPNTATAQYKNVKMNRTTKKCLHFLGNLFIPFCFFFSALPHVNAQKGLFVKLSVGSGVTTEFSNINSNSLSIVTKNHAIGWGITDKFALQIGEFGGLNKQKVGNYNYVNLDAFGLGFSYRIPRDIKISVLGAYSTVSFAEKWSQSFGNNGGKGYGMNISIDKEWFVAKRWGLRFGPQFYWLKTTDTNYNFFNASINGSLAFYLTPVR